METKKEIKTRGRKQTADGPTQNPKYFQQYYHTSGLGDRIPCDICGRSTNAPKLKRHQRTNLCLTTKNKKLSSEERLKQQNLTELTEQAMIQEEINSLN